MKFVEMQSTSIDKDKRRLKRDMLSEITIIIIFFIAIWVMIKIVQSDSHLHGFNPIILIPILFGFIIVTVVISFIRTIREYRDVSRKTFN